MMRESTRTLKNMPPACFLRTAVRRAVLFSHCSQNKAPPPEYGGGALFCERATKKIPSFYKEKCFACTFLTSSVVYHMQPHKSIRKHISNKEVNYVVKTKMFHVYLF